MLSAKITSPAANIAFGVRFAMVPPTDMRQKSPFFIAPAVPLPVVGNAPPDASQEPTNEPPPATMVDRISTPLTLYFAPEARLIDPSLSSPA